VPEAERCRIYEEVYMPWRVEYEPEKGMVVVTASGEIRNEDATAQAADAIRLAKRNQASLVLLDYSEALSEVSLPSLYELPDYFSQRGMPWNARVAVVLPRTRYRIETYQFFELVSRNAGYNLKLFETNAAAETWLAQAPPVRAHAAHLAHA
jgi:hypothetical protein